MIKVYLATISTLYEGEDIEVRYFLFKDEVLVAKETIFLEYVKPSISGLASILTILDKLVEYKELELAVILNDSSLYEILNGTSTTNKVDVLKMASKIKRKLATFKSLSFTNVDKDKKGLAEWKEIVEA